MKKLISVLLVCAQLFCLSVFLSAESSALEDLQVEHTAGAYLYNFENDRVLYKLNEEEKIYPTSAVKLMTGLLAVENLGERLDEEITITAAMLADVAGNNIELMAGEVVSVRDMIAALLVNGANDAAYVLAFTISGSAEKFVAMMNTKAKSLGAYKTYYTNPTGMHNENMYTTVADTAIIAKEAYQQSLLMEYTGTIKYTMSATNKAVSRLLYNRNCLLSVYYDKNYYYAGVKGMNAGSTPDGGHCVITASTNGDLTYLAIAMGGETVDGTIYSYVDVTRMLDWAFASYGYVNVLSPDQVVCEIPVTLSTAVDYVTLVSKDTLSVYLANDVDIKKEITLSWVTYSENLAAPVAEGQVAGYITAMYKDEMLGTSDLIATTDVSRSDFLFALYNIEKFSKSRFFIATVVAAVVFSLVYVFGNAFLRQKTGKSKKRY